MNVLYINVPKPAKVAPPIDESKIVLIYERWKLNLGRNSSPSQMRERGKGPPGGSASQSDNCSNQGRKVTFLSKRDRRLRYDPKQLYLCREGHDFSSLFYRLLTSLASCGPDQGVIHSKFSECGEENGLRWHIWQPSSQNCIHFLVHIRHLYKVVLHKFLRKLKVICDMATPFTNLFSPFVLVRCCCCCCCS
jgi:hypothetical protein